MLCSWVFAMHSAFCCRNSECPSEARAQKHKSCYYMYKHIVNTDRKHSGTGRMNKQLLMCSPFGRASPWPFFWQTVQPVTGCNSQPKACLQHGFIENMFHVIFAFVLLILCRESSGQQLKSSKSMVAQLWKHDCVFNPFMHWRSRPLMAFKRK